jgi:heme/copper-type cytochrome/quinol oxidase subunit 2
MTKPPLTIVLAFWGWVVTAAIRLIGAVVAITTRQSVVDALNEANLTSGPQSHPLPEDQIQLTANLIVGGNVVVSALVAGLFLLFAFKLRAGRNWARILLIFAALVDLLLFVQSGSFSVISVVSALIAIATIVLSYLRPSTDYIAAVRANRAQRNG